jgi:hypothetical protein
MDEIAERIGEQFVTQTRFDPQRRAETEQMLYQQIPELLRSLATQSEISCTLEGHTARIGADALRPVGAAFTRALSPLLPEASTHIALDTLLSALPGLEFPHDCTKIGPEIVPAIARTMAVPEGALHFQREAPCGTTAAVERVDTGNCRACGVGRAGIRCASRIRLGSIPAACHTPTRGWPRNTACLWAQAS